MKQKRFGIKVGSYFRRSGSLPGTGPVYIVVRVRKRYITLYEPVTKALTTIALKEYRRWTKPRGLIILDEAHQFLSPLKDPTGYQRDLEAEADRIHRGLFMLMVRKGWTMPQKFDGNGLAAQLLPSPGREGNPLAEVIEVGYRRCRKYGGIEVTQTASDLPFTHKELPLRNQAAAELLTMGLPLSEGNMQLAMRVVQETDAVFGPLETERKEE